MHFNDVVFAAVPILVAKAPSLVLGIINYSSYFNHTFCPQEAMTAPPTT